MKKLIVICTVVLIALTVLAIGTLPERRSNVPLLYWTSDSNPARGPQIAAFERWMTDKGYGAVELELDSNNTGTMKVIIQATSGVGSEIIDIGGGGRDFVNLFKSLNVIKADATDDGTVVGHHSLADETLGVSEDENNLK